MKKSILLFVGLLTLPVCYLRAQQQKTTQNDSTMVTVLLRHIQDRPVDSIQDHAMRQHFYGLLEKSHARVVSWYVAMGIGQILTLKFPAKDLRQVNMIFEKGAWGNFHTEFYPTYDYAPIWPTNLAKEKEMYRNVH